MSYEYASFWIWDRRNVAADCFDRLRTLTEQGWQVVGKFLEMPEVTPHAGLWMLRRAIVAQKELPKAA